MDSENNPNLGKKTDAFPSSSSASESGEYGGIFTELISPLNASLLVLCAFLVYQLLKSRFGSAREASVDGSQGVTLAPMKKQDFTLAQLREYNGTTHDGRILIAVNGKVFDVTGGKKTYGPGGPYAVFAGRDASRSLGTFSLSEEVIKDTWDDLSDLRTEQMDKIREWEIQFREKYVLVGRLLRTGEEPTDYTDTEDEHNQSDSRLKGE